MRVKKDDPPPPKAQSAAAIRASISFSPEVYQTLEEIARQKKVSLAWVVRDAADRYITDKWPLLAHGSQSSLTSRTRSPRLHCYQPGLPGLCPVSAAVTDLANAGAGERGAVFTRREVVDFILDLVGYTTGRPLHKLQSFSNRPSVEEIFSCHAIERLISAWLTAPDRTGDLAQAIARTMQRLTSETASARSEASQLVVRKDAHERDRPAGENGNSQLHRHSSLSTYGSSTATSCSSHSSAGSTS